MIEAVISLILPGVWVTELVKRFEVELRILDTIPFDKGGCQDLAEIKLNDASMEEVEKYIRSLPDIESVEMEMVEGNKAIGVIKCKMCFACRDLIDSNCFLISAKTKEMGQIEWSLVASNNDCLRNLIARLQEHGAEPSVVKMKKISDEELLTENQEKIVKTAYERGYYDFPKRIGVKELADIFKISTATLSEILRRGQRKIIESYFEK